MLLSPDLCRPFVVSMPRNKRRWSKFHHQHQCNDTNNFEYGRSRSAYGRELQILKTFCAPLSKRDYFINAVDFFFVPLPREVSPNENLVSHSFVLTLN
mmetsp:Transcript_17484/g.48293  ORF Transcript_17484/g.48293 Transcript_17484/m.48293 type:complete len:98 (-) Transcript_17484:345-638(-)